MSSSQTVYRVTERQVNFSIQSTFAADGVLEVTVQLLQPATSLIWKGKVSEESLSACHQAIHSVEKHSKSTASAPFYEIAELSPSGSRELVSWDQAQENADLSSARKTLESNGHSRYLVALTYLRFGSGSAERQDQKTAGMAYKEGIAVLGDAYRDHNILDDTGMKLVLARSTEAKEGLVRAAPIYQRVLESRISTYASREKLVGQIIQGS